MNSVRIVFLAMALATAPSGFPGTSAAASQVDAVPLVVFPDRFAVITGGEMSTRKLKFPVIDRDVLVYLIAPIESDNSRYVAHDVPAALTTEGWVLVPEHGTDAKTQPADAWGGTDVTHRPLAFFDGPTVLSASSDGSTKVDYVGNQVAVDGMPQVDARDLRDLSIPADGGGGVAVNGAGVIDADGRVVFNCGDAISHEASGGRHAIAYYDGAFVPRVALVEEGGSGPVACDAITTQVEGVSPAFSGNGKFLAVATPRRADEGRNLIVYRVGPDAQIDQVVSDGEVEIYDIRTEAFKFKGSLNWVDTPIGAILHYRRTPPEEKLLVHRLRCLDDGCKRIDSLRFPACVSFDYDGAGQLMESHPNLRDDVVSTESFMHVLLRLSGPCGGDSTLDNRLLIDRIEWSAVANVDGRVIIAVQAVVAFQPATTAGGALPPWTSRILLFETPGSTR